MRKTLILAAMVFFIAAPQAFGQEHYRRGLWGGLGFGWSGLNCFDCGGGGMESGWGGASRIGGTVSPSLRLAGGTNTWNKSESGVSVQASTLTFQAHMYPSAGDFFVYAGGGLGFASIDWDIEETYGAITLGTGYSANLGQSKGWAIMPEFSGTLFTNDALTYFLQASVGFYWN
jgi:hypothetical protein